MTTLDSTPAGGSLRRRVDHLLHDAFANEVSPRYHVVQTVIVVLIVVSVISVALESVQSLYVAYKPWFDAEEVVVVTLFTLEYLINIYVAHNRRRYVFGIWGAIDLLAVLPSLLLMFDLRALKVGRVLRVLRFLRLTRMLRALKLAKVAARDVDERRGKVNTLKVDLQIYVVALFSALAIFSTLEFYAEEHVANTQFTSIPQAMWWCITTLTTTGYGDMYPATATGRLVAAATMLTGLALFGLLINVVGKAMLSSLFGASDLESHDEMKKHAAALITARRRHQARRAGVATGMIALPTEHELLLMEQQQAESAAVACRNCGEPNDSEWKACPYCGALR